jgi:hypothetical protein
MLCTTNTVKPFPPHHAPFETGSRKRSGLFVINESIFALCNALDYYRHPTGRGTSYRIQKRLSSRRGDMEDDRETLALKILGIGFNSQI